MVLRYWNKFKIKIVTHRAKGTKRVREEEDVQAASRDGQEDDMQSATSSFVLLDEDDSEGETYSNASINARNRRRQERLNATEYTVFIENFEVDINSSPINQVIMY